MVIGLGEPPVSSRATKSRVKGWGGGNKMKNMIVEAAMESPCLW
jgi:hypothetical protein